MVRSRGWSPREHQLALLAKARDDRSALLIAPTGAGKTLAGFLPTLVELSSFVAPRPSRALCSLRPRSGGEGAGVGGGSASSRCSCWHRVCCTTPHPARASLAPRHALRARGEGSRGARLRVRLPRRSGLHLHRPRRAAQRRPPHPLHLAAEGARGRHRAQSGNADRRDGAADQGRDPHRRHAGVAAAAAAALSAGHPADHARATGAAVVVRRCAVPVLVAEAHRARRAARAGHLQARRSVVAGAGAAVAAGAGAARDRTVGHRGRAGIAGALSGAAARRPRAKPPISWSPAARRRRSSKCSTRASGCPGPGTPRATRSARSTT